MKINAVLILLLVTVPVIANETTLLKDDFSNAEFKQRRASRGDWKIESGVATCTQDDELFKKFQDHGPIIFYDLPHTDATVRFSFKSQGAKSVVFTANGDKGHVFRFVLTSAGMSVRAFPPGGSAKSISLGQEKIPFPSDKWLSVEVKLASDKATVKVGDAFEKTYQHPSLANSKENLSIGFSYGTLSIKDFVVQK